MANPQDADSKPPDIYFKCHPGQVVGIVVCIVCETAWHKSDYLKIKNHGKFLSNIFVICKDHKDPANITSNSEKKDLIHLKEANYKLESNIKKYKDQAKFAKTQLELLQQAFEDLKKVSAKTDVSVLQTDNLLLQNELSKLANEKQLLVKISSEINEKCEVYKELNEELKLKFKKMEEEKDNHTRNMNYSQAVANTNQQYKQFQNVNTNQTLIITPKANQTAEKTKSDIESKLDPEALNVQVITVKKMKEGKVKVVCCNKEGIEKLKNEIHSTLESDYVADTEKLEKPKIKITGINRKYENEELEQKLIDLNFAYDKSKFLKVSYIQPIQRQKNNENNNTANRNNHSSISYNAYIELDPEYFHRIMSTGKIYVGWQRCAAYEDLNMSRCFKCTGYGHGGKKCNSDYVCLYCAGAHDSKTCKNKHQKKCGNCLAANTKYNMNRSVNHIASDTKCCETYKSRMHYLKSKIDYSINHG